MQTINSSERDCEQLMNDARDLRIGFIVVAVVVAMNLLPWAIGVYS
jgi:hypothetical protein